MHFVFLVSYTSAHMRAALLICCLLLSLTAKAQEPYPLTPDSEVQNVPHGTVEKTTLPPGQFYPGTPHTVSIYLPPNAGAEPLPYMVFLDGSGYLGGRMRAATVFDNLIAKHQLPPMVGIFIDPGVLPAIRPDAQNRYERVFEYDSLSNRYVNFLMQEVVPFVEKRHALSKDPNAHAIGGTSTGAVGAFVAAWHRPDQFRRVLSLIGTYVAMKGADTLPELVRKTEPKPIRIWMQDGANDHITPDEPYGTFFAGTWPRANQLLFDALQFSGYDAKLTIGTGGHDTKQGSAELPDALRWLWRDYSPEHGIGTIEVHPPAAQSTAGFDKRGSIWATVDAVGGWQEIGPDWAASDLQPTSTGDLYFVDGEDHLHRFDGQVSTQLHYGGWPRAYTLFHGGPNLLAPGFYDSLDEYSPSLQKLKEWKMPHAEWIWSLLSLSDRMVYLLTSRSPTSREDTRIYWADLTTRTAKFNSVKAPGSLLGTLTASPDQAMLVITDREHRHQWSMQLDKDGKPINPEPFYRLEVLDDETGAKGAAFDSIGQVYFATKIGVQIAEANGRIAMILNSPIPDKPVDNIAFGGPDQDWLYVTVDGKLYRRKMKTHAVPVDKPEKPPQPPL
ncbi:alpha/beta hydrolase-fold protein [Terriglobus sp. TAA 43]|uniref:alpha/beta hydrolase-fold protein n=1 Tax=Terriglobus sp. TAA 43 TaxID=278961 RepID=UPI000690317A|nr:alpha/beta hydrolase-fold protein [Terriglobus sp. TAA 43]